MTEFIAEISSNHNGDLNRCRRLIDEAARVGCTGVKFQLFRIEKLFAPQILRVSAEHRLRRRWELPLRFLPLLADHAHDAGLTFGCTPFDIDAVRQLQPHVDFLKVASYEVPWLDVIHTCAATGLPLMISTGMADASETWAAVEAALESGCRDLTLMHCISRYPAPEADCNLAAIGTLRELMDRNFAPDHPDTVFRAGWSDHSVSSGVVSRAVHHWAADVVEFHFDVDGEGHEFGGGHCWLPDRIAPVIQGAFQPVSSACDGTGRIAPADDELAERDWRADPGDGLRPCSAIRHTWPQQQPAARRTGPDVFFVCDGAGLGHVARSLALAEVLRDVHDADVFFFVRDDRAQAAFLDRHGFNYDYVPQPDSLLSSLGFLKGISRAGGPCVCVLDADRPVTELAAGLHERGHLVVVLDQPDCEIAHLGIVPAFGWQTPAGRNDLVGGGDYLLIREDVTALRHDLSAEAADRRDEDLRVVVSFGGLDPNDLTSRVAAALHDLRPEARIQLVVGRGFADADARARLLARRFPEQEIISSGDPLEPLLADASILITAMGVSVGEALALGTPVAILSNYEADAAAVAHLAAAGAVLDLGRHDTVEQVELCVALAELVQVAPLDAMRRAAADLVDGQGARRAATRIMQLVATTGGSSC